MDQGVQVINPADRVAQLVCLREITGDDPDSARADLIDVAGITTGRNDLLAGRREGIY